MEKKDKDLTQTTERCSDSVDLQTGCRRWANSLGKEDLSFFAWFKETKMQKPEGLEKNREIDI